MILTEKAIVKKYVLYTYGIFIILLMLTGLQMIVLPNEVLLWMMKTICSWSPTFAVLFLYGKMYSGTTKKSKWKIWFSGKVSIEVISVVCMIQIALFIVAIEMTAIFRNMEFTELLNVSVSAFLYAFINSLLSGATGEEVGWRGYLQPTLEKKYGVIKGSIVVGLIWGFWHAPLWFISGEYSGMDLVKYIVFFMLFITSTAVIIGITYEKNRNLFVPMFIHFWVNFTLAFVKDKLLDVVMFIAIGYFIFALIMVGCYGKNRVCKVQ